MKKRYALIFFVVFIVASLIVMASPPPEDSLGMMKQSVPPIASDDTIRFTAIGCYGLASYPNAEEVSILWINQLEDA